MPLPDFLDLLIKSSPRSEPKKSSNEAKPWNLITSASSKIMSPVDRRIPILTGKPPINANK